MEGENNFPVLSKVADLLDSRYRIPYTDIRFGLDFLIGLVPYAGDLISFLISAVLVISMARHGVSGRALLIMLWNILLDTVVGSIPILGDIFDLKYRANRRNLNILLEHYEEGAHQGSAWPIILTVLVVLFGMFFLLIWLLWKMVLWSFGF